MLAAIAISETDKLSAFPLIQSGYAQSRQSVQCPLCGAKYLVLIDAAAYAQNSLIRESVQSLAVDFFTNKLREAHTTGHQENQLVMI